MFLKINNSEQKSGYRSVKNVDKYLFYDINIETWINNIKFRYFINEWIIVELNSENSKFSLEIRILNTMKTNCLKKTNYLKHFNSQLHIKMTKYA